MEVDVPEHPLAKKLERAQDAQVTSPEEAIKLYKEIIASGTDTDTAMEGQDEPPAGGNDTAEGVDTYKIQEQAIYALGELYVSKRCHGGEDGEKELGRKPWLQCIQSVAFGHESFVCMLCVFQAGRGGAQFDERHPAVLCHAAQGTDSQNR